MTALQTQVGGSHYKNRVIQPVTFAMINGYDFCCASALKYITRYPEKEGKVDLQKAQHFGFLRLETFSNADMAILDYTRGYFTPSVEKGLSPFCGIPMSEYIEKNQLIKQEAALHGLHQWFMGKDERGTQFFDEIAILIQEYGS